MGTLRHAKTMMKLGSLWAPSFLWPISFFGFCGAPINPNAAYSLDGIPMRVDL